MDLRGIKYQDILKMDLSQVPKKDLRPLAGRVVSAVNKRIRGLEKAGKKVRTKPLSIRGKSEKQVLREMERAKTFLAKPISSASDWKRHKKEIRQRRTQKAKERRTTEKREQTKKKISALQKKLHTPWYDIQKMNKEELQQFVRAVMLEANKRLSILQKKGYLQEKEKFITKDKTRNELISEYARAKRFLESKISTEGGRKEISEKSLSRLQEEAGIDIDLKDYDRLWQAVDKAAETHKIFEMKIYRYKGIDIINEEISASRKELDEERDRLIIEGLSDDGIKDVLVNKILDKVAKKLKGLYDIKQAEYAAAGFGISSHFTKKS